ASPTKAWLVEHRSDPRWQRNYRYAFGKRPGEELYDLRRDPDQARNVADDPSYAEARQRLSAQWMQILAETDDPRVAGDGSTFDRPPFTDAGERRRPPSR